MAWGCSVGIQGFQPPRRPCPGPPPQAFFCSLNSDWSLGNCAVVPSGLEALVRGQICDHRLLPRFKPSSEICLLAFYFLLASGFVLFKKMVHFIQVLKFSIIKLVIGCT